MIEIWDCSGAQDFPELNGFQVSPIDLIGVARRRAARSGASADWLAHPFDLLDFHPLALVKPGRWERALATTILALSGQVPTRDELVHGREVVAGLPATVRRALEPEHVLRVLAPLLIGFRLSRAADYVREANRHRDMSRVMARLLEARPVVIDIPLCAHRDAASIAPLGRPASPSRQSARQVCALLRAILSNAHVGSAEVRFRQQEASERASACMFPNLFAVHVEQSQTQQLLMRLEQQRQAMAELVQPFDGAGIRFHVLGLDELSRQADADLAAAFGEDWMHIEASRTRADLPGGLERVAFESALNHVSRLMPEVGRLKMSAPRMGPRSSQARAAERWFAERCRMTPAARALFEIAFYRAWGRTARADGSIGLGFDRDFSAFQRHAWQLAFEVGANDPVPLLYARRTAAAYRGGGLRNLSFRQFWGEGAIDSAADAA